jgi:hypothetical protein
MPGPGTEKVPPPDVFGVMVQPADVCGVGDSGADIQPVPSWAWADIDKQQMAANAASALA